MMRAMILSGWVMVGAGCASGAGAGVLGPDEGALATSDGKVMALGEMAAEHDATVLVWWASTCPCVKRYAARVEDLATRHGGERVAFYYVASNADDDDEAVRAADGRWPLPILRDDGAVLARHLGVISTPTVVVIDRVGRVRFHGWIDNERAPGEPGREAWLEETLGEVLAGADEATRRTPVWGCTVTRSLGQAGRCHTPRTPPVGQAVAPAP